MRKWTFFVVLLSCAVLVLSSVSGALTSPAFLQSLNLPGMNPAGLSSMQSTPLTTTQESLVQSAPVTASQGSTVASPFNSGGWSINNMQFFKPREAQTKSDMGLQSSDIGPIMQMLSQMPSPQQAQQYYNPTPTPAPVPVAAFNSLPGTVPADSVLFIEISKTIMPVDPTSAGFAVPNVTMNYKYDANNNQLVLKKKNGTNYDGLSVVVGYIEDNQLNNVYKFDYTIGSSPYSDVKIVYTGSDGRASIVLGGTQKDLKKGEKAEYQYTEGNVKYIYSVVNYGLVPRTNFAVQDKLT